MSVKEAKFLSLGPLSVLDDVALPLFEGGTLIWKALMAGGTFPFFIFNSTIKVPF